MERSRKLTLTDWTKANDALNLHFEGNKSKLTKHLDMSRTTVTAFFKQNPIREAEFRKICFALRLNWQEVSAVEAIAPKQEDWIEEVRSRCCQRILYQHGTIRLLSQAEVEVDQLYVGVWVLNGSPRTFPVLESTLLRSFDLRNDRSGLSNCIKPNEGMAIANENSRLIIQGRLGAGKTIFLKHLAVDCSNGKFQPDLIPVLIELGRIRSAEWKLLDAISGELKVDNQQTQTLLKQGKLLILIDGLDEVPTSAFRHNVKAQICSLAQELEHLGNRFILTCRTQIIGEIPQGFVSVELKEFNEGQVKNFFENWFRANGLTKVDITQQWQRFLSAVGRNLALKELTVTPVLLSLMCFVWQVEGNLPTQKALLYEKGIGWLLNKWNDRKEIPEWEIGTQVYQKLEPEQKETLLIEIAARKFESLDNFVLFEQRDLAKQIANFLNLKSAREGEAVLKAIEAQHGLLVERADELWSFSHLAFQEYFVAREIVDHSNYQSLLENIADKRWREVCLLTVNMLPKAGHLLTLIKQRVDSLGCANRAIQHCLRLVYNKFPNVESLLKLTKFQDCEYAEAAFWLLVLRALCLDCVIEHVHNIHLAFILDAGEDINSFSSCLRASQGLEFYKSFELAMTLEDSIGEATDIEIEELASFELASQLNKLLDPVKYPMKYINFDFLKKHLALNLLKKDAHHLGQEMNSWWNLNGNAWNKKFRQFMTEYKSYLQDLKFNQQELFELRNYYYANKLLIDCLKSDCDMDRDVRQEIEDNLLLPIAELKRRLPDQYS